MKVVVFENNHASQPAEDSPGWYLVADSAISNTGKPFYIPEEAGKVVVNISPAFKISRLGKYIDPRFAPRYYKEYAPAVHFVIPALKEELIRSGRGISRAVSFDKSIMAGDFQPLPPDMQDIRLSLKLNGEKLKEWKYSDMHRNPELLLHEYSKSNTVKMGDIFLPAPFGDVAIGIGDYLEVMCGDSQAFSVKVK